MALSGFEHRHVCLSLKTVLRITFKSSCHIWSILQTVLKHQASGSKENVYVTVMSLLAVFVYEKYPKRLKTELNFTRSLHILFFVVYVNADVDFLRIKTERR